MFSGSIKDIYKIVEYDWGLGEFYFLAFPPVLFGILK